MPAQKLQPTYIVGTKTFCKPVWILLHPLQPTYIVGTKTSLSLIILKIRHNYNPRISWVLKLRSVCSRAAWYSLQPTYIVGTKTNLQRS